MAENHQFQVMPNFIVNPMTPRIKLDGVYPLLGDHSRRNVGKVDYCFIGSHALFSMPVQFLGIQKEWSLPAPKAASVPSFLATAVLPLKSILRLISNPLFAAWVTAPDRVRAATYSLLKRVGRWVYGRQFEARVQRLPFGLYLKEHSSVRAGNNEFNALRLAHKYTTTSPAPTAIDMVLLPASDKCYVLSTRLPGLPLSRCVYALSDQDLNHVATQLKDYLAQLRSIPGPANTEAPISNTAGEAIMDTRIKEGTPVGPFADEASFSQLLGFPDDPARRGHKVVFTHADMNPRNIMVDRSVRPDSTLGWSLSGIVDRESAGYYPEYWEYTKALWEVRPTFERPHAMMHEVFRALGDYSAELDVESRSRELW